VEQSSDALVAISAIEGFSANDIYLARTTPVLRSGFLEHFDGSSWQPVLETTYSVVAMSATTDGKLFASGVESTMLYFDGSDWHSGAEWLALEPPSERSFVDLWAASETDLYVGHDNVGDVYHYDGAGFQQQAIPTEDQPAPSYALWGAASDDVYAAIYLEGLFHFDGATWTKVAHPGAIVNAIHGRSATDIWAVGSQVLHYDGTSWELVPVSAALLDTGILNPRFLDVWVSPSGKTWIVGEQGVALFGDASGFEYVPTDVSVALFTVWGSSENDVWVGGVQETLLHYTTP
jgi:hypothetical protein